MPERGVPRVSMGALSAFMMWAALVIPRVPIDFRLARAG